MRLLFSAPMVLHPHLGFLAQIFVRLLFIHCLVSLGT